MSIACHDQSPFVDFECPNCGFVAHVHLTQLPPGYQDLELRTYCKGCEEELVIPQPIIWGGRK